MRCAARSRRRFRGRSRSESAGHRQRGVRPHLAVLSRPLPSRHDGPGLALLVSVIAFAELDVILRTVSGPGLHCGMGDLTSQRLTGAGDASMTAGGIDSRQPMRSVARASGGGCMELGLRGKVAIITGGSKGIGLACAQALAAEGARVGIISRSQDNVDAALARLDGAAGHAADLCDPAAASTALDAIEAKLGPADILVNSAGAARRTPPEELTPDVWRAAMDAKYFSYINVIDPMIRRMAARGAGVIVNVIGNGGKVASPIHLPGGSANAALMLATAGLATAYAPKGVRVVAVNPGLTNTGRVAEGLASEARLLGVSPEAALERAVARVPLGRLAEPEEIASVVTFLASQRASYLTGVSITMDGAATAMVV